jgi:hypothetical protein
MICGFRRSSIQQRESTPMVDLLMLKKMNASNLAKRLYILRMFPSACLIIHFYSTFIVLTNIFVQFEGD